MRTSKCDEPNAAASDDPILQAGNPVKEILLPDHKYNILYCKTVLMDLTISIRSYDIDLAMTKTIPGTEEPELENEANVYGSRWECFQNTMQPRYTHVSRSTRKGDAMILWLAAKQEIIDSFGNLNACVNLTTDVWSAPHGVSGSYMYVTAHWIDPDTWQMMKRVISFEEFPSPHTGHVLFKMLIKVLTKFNLEDKVMSITLDNASNNTSAMDKLKLKYDPPMGGRFYHSRCVAHIINLVVQAGLKVSAIHAIRESFKTMLKDIFKSSARTRQRYVKICKDAEKPCLRPNWDVLTRWNSTYHTFLSGLKQQNTLAYFHDLLANKNRCNHFSAENWVIIQSLTQLLEVFNTATEIYQGFTTKHLHCEDTLSPGGPRYDYMMSSEAEDDY
nr:zinc finger BED domain-containing protein RICESLEEPER 2-like [Tanacetum cinerariifolium]